MKTLKKLLPVLAVILGLGIVFGASAFKTTVKTPVTYHYKSNSHAEADIEDIANWEVADEESPSCGEAGSLVCRYSFEGDINDFEDFLVLSTTTAATVNGGAIAKKL